MALQDLINGIDRTLTQLQADRARLEAKLVAQEAAYAAMTPQTQEMAKGLHDQQCQLPGHSICGGLDGDLENVDWTQEEPKDWLRLVHMALGIYQNVVGE
jgi:hypothetical protein